MVQYIINLIKTMVKKLCSEHKQGTKYVLNIWYLKYHISKTYHLLMPAVIRRHWSTHFCLCQFYSFNNICILYYWQYKSVNFNMGHANTRLKIIPILSLFKRQTIKENQIWNEYIWHLRTCEKCSIRNFCRLSPFCILYNFFLCILSAKII
jgi:hypothetical protein